VELVEALHRESIVATAELAAEVERVAALLPQIPDVPQPDDGNVHATSRFGWLPSLREPHDLFIAYSSGLSHLARASAGAAAADLAALELPSGLERPQFDALVGSRLMQNATVQGIDAFVSESQRFGAVRDLLARLLDVDRDEADYTWQTLMRWLLEFLPERYDRRTANYSEIFRRRDAPHTDVP
jgi:hypothetical protein